MKAEMNFDNIGGGDTKLYYTHWTANSSSTVSVNITGKAKLVYIVEQRGYVSTNEDKNTGEISDSYVYTSSTAYGDVDTKNTTLYITRTNGNITFNGFNTAYSYAIFYTLE